MDYKIIKMKNLNFINFVGLCSKIGISFGIVVGIIAFVGSLFGLSVENTLGFMTVTGAPAGILSILLGPVVGGVEGLIAGIMAYLPFRWIFLR